MKEMKKIGLIILVIGAFIFSGMSSVWALNSYLNNSYKGANNSNTYLNSYKGTNNSNTYLNSYKGTNNSKTYLNKYKGGR